MTARISVQNTTFKKKAINERKLDASMIEMKLTQSTADIR